MCFGDGILFDVSQRATAERLLRSDRIHFQIRAFEALTPRIISKQR